MKEYPDPEQFLNAHIKQSTQHYVDGLQRAKLKHSPKLTRAVSERVRQKGSEQYIQEASAVRDHTIEMILKGHNQRMNQIKREGASLRLKTCPLIALVFGVLAWYSFHHSHIGFGILYALGSLAFLAMLVLGALFDRPRL